MTSRDVARSAPTIFDVARLAGVSHQTVSRVINGHASVRDTTRQRVLQAVEQLRYRPNVAARAMGGRRVRNIGLITPGSSDYGPSNTVLGLLAAARSAGYTVSMASASETDADAVPGAVDLVLGQHADAVVVVASHQQMLAGVAALTTEVPLLVVDSSGRSVRPTLAIDQYAGARIATEHLIALGHRDIVHVAGPPGAMDAIERIRGWRDTMAEHGLVAPTPLQGDWTPDSGFSIGAQLIAAQTRFSAVFSANDQMALGCVHALRDAGVRVPDDVSIVGFDDLPESPHFDPPLTTVRQDFRQLGTDLLTAVIALLDGRPVPRCSAVTPALVVRKSTLPHPA